MAPGSTQRLSGAEGVCCRGGGTRPSVPGSPPNPLWPYHLPSEPPSTQGPSCRLAARGEPDGAASAPSPAPWPRRSGPSFRQRSEAWGPPNLKGEESAALPACQGGAGPAGAGRQGPTWLWSHGPHGVSPRPPRGRRPRRRAGCGRCSRPQTARRQAMGECTWAPWPCARKAWPPPRAPADSRCHHRRRR